MSNGVGPNGQWFYLSAVDEDTESRTLEMFADVNVHGNVTANNLGGASNPIVLETPTGAANGSNAVFVFTAAPVAVFLNGILQEEGAGADFTISGATVTFNFAPANNDRVRGLVQ